MYWLYVLFLMNGTWIPGENFEGWGAATSIEPRRPGFGRSGDSHRA
jgi:hypothetical protein